MQGDYNRYMGEQFYYIPTDPQIQFEMKAIKKNYLLKHVNYDSVVKAARDSYIQGISLA